MSSDARRPLVLVVGTTGTANLASVCAGLSRAGAQPQLTLDVDQVASFDGPVMVPGVGSFDAAMRALTGSTGSTTGGSSTAAPDTAPRRTMADVLRARVRARKATCFVCVGLQILAARSEESGQPSREGGDISGLDCLAGVPQVRRFPSDKVKVPQHGWNQVELFGDDTFSLLEPGYAYFTNSYAIPASRAGFEAVELTPAFSSLAAARQDGWKFALAQHGFPFLAAAELGGGSVLATQFHPELSGSYGQRLLVRWVAAALGVNSTTLRSASSAQPATDTQLSSLAGEKLSSLAGAGSPSTVCRRVIPCLDVKDGRVVKGVQFQNLRDCGDPAEVACAYERAGADELCMLDVSATPDGRRTCLETLAKIRQKVFDYFVGGSIRGPRLCHALLWYW